MRTTELAQRRLEKHILNWENSMFKGPGVRKESLRLCEASVAGVWWAQGSARGGR